MERILIANRGEIACRVIRTVQQLGKQAIAVYSEADADALHCQLADTAVAIGPAPPQQSYLNIDAILHAATVSGAEGIHPGYGFLAENATFARRCQQAGVVFIGPTPEAMDAMGEQGESPPDRPGCGGAGHSRQWTAPLDLASAQQYAEAIGYPVLLKAAGGGGGIGMQVVATPRGLAKAFTTAQHRAQAAFGNPRSTWKNSSMRLGISKSRYSEISMGPWSTSMNGNVPFNVGIRRLWKRPPPLLARPEHDALRARLTQAALADAAAVQYTNAGTVEFLVDEALDWYFIEMNTRLQVEHPLTGVSGST